MMDASAGHERRTQSEYVIFLSLYFSVQSFFLFCGDQNTRNDTDNTFRIRVIREIRGHSVFCLWPNSAPGYPKFQFLNRLHSAAPRRSTERVRSLNATYLSRSFRAQRSRSPVARAVPHAVRPGSDVSSFRCTD